MKPRRTEPGCIRYVSILMNVFLQGMRRSGTTVFFDMFLSDGRFACFYEPLARMHRPSIGGGSGLRDVDLFASARSRRDDFMRRWKVTERDMNAGAPLNPETEFTTELPVHEPDFSSLADAFDRLSSPDCPAFARGPTDPGPAWRQMTDALNTMITTLLGDA